MDLNFSIISRSSQEIVSSGNSRDVIEAQLQRGKFNPDDFAIVYGALEFGCAADAQIYADDNDLEEDGIYQRSDGEFYILLLDKFLDLKLQTQELSKISKMHFETMAAGLTAQGSKGSEMRVYTLKNFSFFWDRLQRQWVLYPIDSEGLRIEWDDNDEPIEAEYFNNKKDLLKWLSDK